MYPHRKFIYSIQVVLCIYKKKIEEVLRRLKEVLRTPPRRCLEDVLKKASSRLPLQTNLRRLWDQNLDVFTTSLRRLCIGRVKCFNVFLKSTIPVTTVLKHDFENSVYCKDKSIRHNLRKQHSHFKTLMITATYRKNKFWKFKLKIQIQYSN